VTHVFCKNSHHITLFFRRPENSITRCLALFCVFLISTSALSQSVKMSVNTAKTPEGKLAVKGSVSASGLLPKGQMNVGNSISILFEYIEAGGTYRVLPEAVSIRPAGLVKGGRLLTKEEEMGVKTASFSVWGTVLDNTKDEGKTFEFDKTIDTPEKAVSYRIVATLEHRFSGTWPAIIYKHQFSGPQSVSAAGVPSGDPGQTSEPGNIPDGQDTDKQPGWNWSVDDKPPFDVPPPGAADRPDMKAGSFNPEPDAVPAEDLVLPGEIGAKVKEIPFDQILQDFIKQHPPQGEYDPQFLQSIAGLPGSLEVGNPGDLDAFTKQLKIEEWYDKRADHNLNILFAQAQAFLKNAEIGLYDLAGSCQPYVRDSLPYLVYAGKAATAGLTFTPAAPLVPILTGAYATLDVYTPLVKAGVDPNVALDKAITVGGFTGLIQTAMMYNPVAKIPLAPHLSLLQPNMAQLCPFITQEGGQIVIKKVFVSASGNLVKTLMKNTATKDLPSAKPVHDKISGAGGGAGITGLSNYSLGFKK
jgi:hypothetical protein